jgi:hypothetical protein
MSQRPPQDRRRIPRVPVFFILERLGVKRPQPNEWQGVVKNLTPEGLLLETDIALNKNDLLQLSFTLPHTDTTLNLEARVRWSENKKAWATAGLEFLNLEPEQYDSIMGYLAGLGPEV